MLKVLQDQRGAQQPQMEGLKQDVSRLKEWASGLTEKRAQLEGSLTSLRNAVGQIEERTSSITKDFANKVCRIVCVQTSHWKCKLLSLCSRISS